MAERKENQLQRQDEQQAGGGRQAQEHPRDVRVAELGRSEQGKEADREERGGTPLGSDPRE